MLKLYTMPNTRTVATVTATYSYSSNRWNANMSEIYSALICAAATYCDRYQSDVLYDIGSVAEYLSSGCVDGATFWFGFRDCGVDHAAFIESRLSAPGCYGANPYRKVMALVCGVPDSDGRMEIALMENIKAKIAF